MWFLSKEKRLQACGVLVCAKEEDGGRHPNGGKSGWYFLCFGADKIRVRYARTRFVVAWEHIVEVGETYVLEARDMNCGSSL